MKSTPKIHKVKLDHDIAFFMTIQRGLIRLVSIIITFIFWFFIAVIIFSLHLLGFVHVDQLFQKLSTVVGTLGISPLLLTVLTWRKIEKLCSLFLKTYVSTHLINPKIKENANV